MSAVSVLTSGLTSREVDNLIRENRLILDEGDMIVVPEGSLLFQQLVLNSDGTPKLTKDGEQIRALSVVALIYRDLPKVWTVGRLSLSFLCGEDLYVEDTCPLLPTKDGKNKYAATYKLTKVDTRDYTLPVKEDDCTFTVQLTLKAGELKEGFLSPSFAELWEEDKATHVWRNVEKVNKLEEVPLRKGRRRVLMIERNPLKLETGQKRLHTSAQERLKAYGYL
ncbi:MAG: hypothetical protein MJ224_02640 [archaeon]|nr:hypothetical protein [archaeon]